MIGVWVRRRRMGTVKVVVRMLIDLFMVTAWRWGLGQNTRIWVKILDQKNIEIRYTNVYR
jgi:hypothetical protein